ncbi:MULTISPECIES: GNAT family N-acetyltransferase [Frankia]|uniref:GNAT family N-acetyltransferase n=1 Tax=Frankia TaxID=1854 RepID=UPI0030DD0013
MKPARGGIRSGVRGVENSRTDGGDRSPAGIVAEPVLRGPRLVLRPLTVAGIGALRAGRCGELESLTGTRITTGIQPPPLLDAALGPVRGRSLTESAAAGWWTWLAVEGATGTAVASPGLGGPPDADGCVTFGQATFAGHTGRGYAVESGCLLLDWAFREPRVRRALMTLPPHAGVALAVAARLGFAAIGRAEDDEVGELVLLERTCRTT